MPKGKGWKLISEMEWKGAKFPVRVCVDYGTFSIEVPTKDPLEPKSFSGKDLEKLREDVKEYLLEQTDLQWECMIHVHNDASRGEIDLKLHRYWRAVHGDGKVVWRNDDAPYNAEPKLGKTSLEDRDQPSERGTFIPYSKEHWKRLRALEADVYYFHEVVDKGIRPDNIAALLEIYDEGALAALVQNPKKWRIEKRGF